MTEKSNRRPYPMSLIDRMVDYAPSCEPAYRDTLREIESELARSESVDHAMGVIQRDYYSDVESIATDLRDRVVSGEVFHEDQMHDALHETIDGSARVIYTFQAKLGLLASANEDAWQNVGYDNPTVEQMMYCALECDVQQHSEFPDPGEWDCYVRIECSQSGDQQIVLDTIEAIRAKGGYMSEPMDDLINAIEADFDPSATDDPDDLGLVPEYEAGPTHRLHCEEIMRRWIDAGLRPDMIEVEG